jgi:hypothetical protein
MGDLYTQTRARTTSRGIRRRRRRMQLPHTQRHDYPHAVDQTQRIHARTTAATASQSCRRTRGWPSSGTRSWPQMHTLRKVASARHRRPPAASAARARYTTPSSTYALSACRACAHMLICTSHPGTGPALADRAHADRGRGSGRQECLAPRAKAPAESTPSPGPRPERVRRAQPCPHSIHATDLRRARERHTERQRVDRRRRRRHLDNIEDDRRVLLCRGHVLVHHGRDAVESAVESAAAAAVARRGCEQ